MELEDGDLMEDAAAAATPGASGMKNDSKIPIKAKRCWIPSPAPLGSNAKLCVLQAVLFWELLHHVVCTDYCSVAETLHWFNKKKKGWGGIIWVCWFKNDVKVWRVALCLFGIPCVQISRRLIRNFYWCQCDLWVGDTFIWGLVHCKTQRMWREWGKESSQVKQKYILNATQGGVLGFFAAWRWAQPKLAPRVWKKCISIWNIKEVLWNLSIFT